MSSSIDVTVAAVIERAGQFLVVEERVGGRAVFNQPAGHLEVGESIIDAAIRETFEETGYRFYPDRLIGVHVWPCDAAGKTYLRICLAGSARAPDGPVDLDDGIIATHWLTRNQLLSQKCTLRSPLVMRAVDEYLDGACHSLDCLQYLPATLDKQVRTG
jgi:8-oxo-dGTP pyrophosphatase MutT (NUDIX family)